MTGYNPRRPPLSSEEDMADTPHPPITALLQEWRAGDRAALERLTPVVYDELRQLARRSMAGERKGHTLQPTALVNEAYLRLVGTDVPWRDRVHFFAVAARLIRRILVDHARARGRAKRSGGARVELDDVMVMTKQPGREMVLLDDALNALGAHDARKAQVVELHFFGGLTYDEIAEAVGISAATVDRDLRLARAWLQRQMAHANDAG
jgi:RNA polymerase sigma-70 factor (ECF subfamily)